MCVHQFMFINIHTRAIYMKDDFKNKTLKKNEIIPLAFEKQLRNNHTPFI